MATRKPVVRHFIACEEVRESASGRYSLIEVVHAIRAAANYPRIHPQITLFVMLTDADGMHDFWVEWVLFDRGQQRSLWTTKPVNLELGQDPTQVHGWCVRLKNIWLPQPGDYEFVLWCDGEIVAREPIRAR
jgi:hypothetical protein